MTSGECIIILLCRPSRDNLTDSTFFSATATFAEFITRKVLLSHHLDNHVQAESHVNQLPHREEHVLLVNLATKMSIVVSTRHGKSGKYVDTQSMECLCRRSLAKH